MFKYRLTFKAYKNKHVKSIEFREEKKYKNRMMEIDLHIK